MYFERVYFVTCNFSPGSLCSDFSADAQEVPTFQNPCAVEELPSGLQLEVIDLRCVYVHAKISREFNRIFISLSLCYIC